MSDERWIVVPNWEKFQRHRDREMVWIKLYTELNSRDDWRRLTFSQRGLLVSIWTEYPRSGFRLRSLDLWGRVGQPDRHGNLEALVQAGFIELSPRAPARPRDAPKEVEEEKEKEKNTTPQPPSKRETTRASSAVVVVEEEEEEFPFDYDELLKDMPT